MCTGQEEVQALFSVHIGVCLEELMDVQSIGEIDCSVRVFNRFLATLTPEI